MCTSNPSTHWDSLFIVTTRVESTLPCSLATPHYKYQFTDPLGDTKFSLYEIITNHM
jgi:hypothetical protein